MRLTRAITLLTLALACSSAAAQPAGPADQKDDPTVIEMTAPPVGEPSSALKYTLLPTVIDRTSGNAAPLYPTYLEHIDRNKNRKAIEKYLDMPLKDLPAEGIRNLLPTAALDGIAIAARRERCDWELPIREQGFNLLLPSLSKFRHVARLLSLKARVQIAEGDFDQAIYTLQTGFAMAQHVGQAPTLIHKLVAVAMSSLLLQTVQEWMQAPNAPNLYWALANLPRPVIDLTGALEWEANLMFLGPTQGGYLLKRGRMTREDFEQLMSAVLTGSGIGQVQREQQAEAQVLSTAIAMKYYTEARDYWIGNGKTAEQVEAMSVAEVAGGYVVETFLKLRDEQFKWFGLPYWQAHEGLKQAEKAIQLATAAGEGYPFIFLMPSLSHSYFISTLLDRKVAALQTIEAIRMYVAENGKLPASLDDISAAPVPINPVTGKPFGYVAKQGRFTLTADAPKGEDASRNEKYVVTVGK